MNVYKILLYIPAIVLFFGSCSEQEIGEEQKESFIKYYGTSNKDVAADIKVLPGGGYAVLGSVNTPDNGFDIYLAKTDEFGNLVEEYILGDHFIDYANSMQINSDGTIYIIGYAIAEAGMPRDMVMYIISGMEQAGPFIYKWKGSVDGNEEGYHLSITDDGIAITGYTDGRNGSKDAFLVFANRNGDELWQKAYGHQTGEDIGRFVHYQNGHFFLTGSTNYNAQAMVTNNQNLWLLKANGDNGKLINSKSVGNEGDDYGIGILPSIDGSVYLAGTMYDAIENEPVIYLANMDEDLNINWEKRYSELNGIITRDICHWNNNLVIAGTNSQNESSQMAIVVVSANGEVVSNKYYGEGTRLSVSSVEMTTDLGLIMAGTNEIRGTSAITIIKLNANGGL